MTSKRPIVEAIARSLSAQGGPWLIDPTYESPRFEKIQGPGIQAILIDVGYDSIVGRGRAFGVYPQGPHGPVRHAETVIGFDLKRDPADLALDIQRRLLSKYVPELQRVREHIQRLDQQERALHKFALELGELIGTKEVAHGDSRSYVTFRTPDASVRGQFEVWSEDSAHVEVHISGADALRNLARTIATALSANLPTTEKL